MKNKNNYSLSHFIGVTASGLQYPVFFDPHYPIRINRPPVTVITGEPGSGKTTAAMTLAAHSAINNKITLILDPKGDFISLKALELSGELPKVSIWSVFSNIDKQEIDESNYGILDPTCITDDPNQNASLTFEIIKSLVPQITHNQSSALIPIVQDVTEHDNPSFRNVVSLLLRNQDSEARALGHNLELFLKLPISQLLVSSSRVRNEMNLKEGTVVMSMLGLKFPTPKAKRETYSNDEVMSVCIMRLLTYLILGIMKTTTKSKFKTLIIDEAWAVFATESGKGLIAEVSLLGRSLNMATILITQSPRHLEAPSEDDSSIENTISSRLAFRNSSKTDNEVNSALMNLPYGWDSIYEALQSGTCLMQDCQNNLSIVDIIVDHTWLQLFETKPQASTENN